MTNEVWGNSAQLHATNLREIVGSALRRADKFSLVIMSILSLQRTSR